MDDNRISKHMEFKEGIKTYKEYLAKLNSVAKKKLEGNVGFLDKIEIQRKIKSREKILEIIGEIQKSDGKAHLSGDMIAKQNESVISALNGLPVLDGHAEQKIVASYINEESKTFDAERTSINEERQKIKKLLASITPKSGFIKISENEYKRLGELFSESLSNLSVFDLKVNTEHKVVDDKLAADLAASQVYLLNNYKKYVLEGKTKEITSLPVANVDNVKNVIVTTAKNEFCLDKLRGLLGIMPKKNANTCKLISDNIKTYEDKIKRATSLVNVDFNTLKAIVNEVEAEERRKAEEAERKVTDNYSLQEKEEFIKQLAICSFTKIDCINKSADATLIDEEINKLLNSDIGKSLSDIEIYNARRVGAERYAELKKIPFNEEVFSASLETKTGKKM